MTHLLVMYDISDDKLRVKVADACLDYGLERVQYSAFVGELGRVHQRELELKIRELVGRRAAHIRLIPLEMHAWKRQQIISTGKLTALNKPEHKYEEQLTAQAEMEDMEAEREGGE